MTAYPVAERRKRRVEAKAKKRAKPAPSLTPHDCVILAVDPGASSGWAVFARGEIVASGECDAFSDVPLTIAASVRDHSRLWKNMPAILVCERPFAASLTTAAGMGAAFGAWKAAWLAAGAVKARIVRVYPSTWRAKVLGRGWGNAPRDKVRPEEQRRAALITGREVGADEAPAVLIGVWASRAGEVAAKLPKRRKP